MAATSASRCSKLSRDAEAKTRPLHNTTKSPTEIQSPPDLAIFARPSAICTTFCPPHEPKRVEWIYIFFGANRGRSLQYHSPRRLFSCLFVHPAGLLGVPAFGRSGRLNSPGTTHLDGPISFVYFLLGIGGCTGRCSNFHFFHYFFVASVVSWFRFALLYILWRRVCDLFFWRAVAFY